jgi:hypothetical protein
MQYKRILECLLTSGALLMAANTAFAQLAPQPADGLAADGKKADAATKSDPNVVVVTANRIRSNVQTTAVAVNVYNGAALAEAGVSNVQALQAIDPSVNVTSSNGAAYVAVRGIASTDTTETGDPAVPIARDGFFTNRSFGIASSMYDVERVEVLKGPQGTLFGRNSTGGLINVITAKPREEFGGYLSADVGNYSTVNLEGAVNVPVSDKVQMRFSAVERHHTGYRELTGINMRGDDEGSKSGRLHREAGCRERCRRRQVLPRLRADPDQAGWPPHALGIQLRPPAMGSDPDLCRRPRFAGIPSQDRRHRARLSGHAPIHPGRAAGHAQPRDPYLHAAEGPRDRAGRLLLLHGT